MTLNVAAATARIGRQLPEAELSLDNALLASTRLMESMLLARQAEGIEVFTGQSALVRLAKTQRTLLTTQHDMMRVHQELLSIGQEVTATADEMGKCPSGRLEDAELARLTA